MSSPIVVNVSLVALLCLGLAACGSTAPLVHYTIATKSPMVCCRSMNFEVADFANTTRTSGADTGVVVRFLTGKAQGGCTAGAEAPLSIANNTERDILVPTSHELDGSRIKLYPWRQHHDSARGAIRLARQIQYGDQFEHPAGARLRLMRLPARSEVRLDAWIPGDWLCTKPTELYEGYLEAELDPAFYSQRSRGLRTSRYEQASELVSPIGMRYDVVWLTLDYLERLPTVGRTESGGGDTVTVQLDVMEEPAQFFNAAQRVATSNIIDLVIEKE